MSETIAGQAVTPRAARSCVVCGDVFTDKNNEWHEWCPQCSTCPACGSTFVIRQILTLSLISDARCLKCLHEWETERQEPS